MSGPSPYRCSNHTLLHMDPTIIQPLTQSYIYEYRLSHNAISISVNTLHYESYIRPRQGPSTNWIKPVSLTHTSADIPMTTHAPRHSMTLYTLPHHCPVIYTCHPAQPIQHIIHIIHQSSLATLIVNTIGMTWQHKAIYSACIQTCIVLYIMYYDNRKKH